ncbi:hypothetical protein [uncultured Corynebacterium sp.]|uniref:hypothetical protein n=1 Tax=uncultured Corynebacterium sp. TaxID=159447 RepID=UPI002626596D|nr:hypothetical protein [uncultured Corynebacterium sp.]
MNDFLARTQEGAAALCRAVSDISARPQLIASVSEEPAVVAGVVAGAIAQVEKARTLTRPSALGVAAVMANHAAYAWSLYRRGARNDALGWGLRVAAWGAGIVATRTQPTAAAVAVGGAAVLSTSALAGDPALRTEAGKGISHGANLLVVAEGLTALRAGLEQHYRGKRKQGARLVGAAEAGALVVGHLLLIDGLCRTR